MALAGLLILAFFIWMPITINISHQLMDKGVPEILAFFIAAAWPGWIVGLVRLLQKASKNKE
jgi:membrane protease YdiL (CAAX protease family)